MRSVSANERMLSHALRLYYAFLVLSAICTISMAFPNTCECDLHVTSELNLRTVKARQSLVSSRSEEQKIGDAARKEGVVSSA